MPEIPEVEGFKYVIKVHCLKKKIIDIDSSDKKLIKHNYADFKKNLIGHEFVSTERRGKYLLIKLNASDYTLVMHFAMTGFLVYSKDSQKVKFSKVNFYFKDKTILHWISVRKFEKIWLIKSFREIPGLNNLGPDPLKLTKKEFIDLLNNNKSKNVKDFLMDQSIISGIGNEYSDEILFQSSIDPHHKIKDLTGNQLLKIYNETHKVLKYSIALRLKDIKKYSERNFFLKSDRETFKSSYLQAHRHTDMICPKNKNHKLKKVTIAGRSSYYCPKDQK